MSSKPSRSAVREGGFGHQALLERKLITRDELEEAEFVALDED